MNNPMQMRFVQRHTLRNKSGTNAAIQIPSPGYYGPPCKFSKNTPNPGAVGHKEF